MSSNVECTHWTGEASQSDTHSQIATIQIHLLLQLREQLVVEGFQLGGRKHRNILVRFMSMAKTDTHIETLIMSSQQINKTFNNLLCESTQR